MLILTRRPEESIRIGEEITITLLGIRGSEVRIGVDAPRAIAVHRQEIYNRIQAVQNGATVGEPPPMVSMRIVSSDDTVREGRAELRKPTGD